MVSKCCKIRTALKLILLLTIIITVISYFTYSHIKYSIFRELSDGNIGLTNVRYIVKIIRNIRNTVIITTIVAITTLTPILYKLVSDRFKALNVDYLTEINNRRFYDVKLNGQIREFKNTKKPFSLMMIDVDLFKRINDKYGHDTGEERLNGISKNTEKAIDDMEKTNQAVQHENYKAFRPKTHRYKTLGHDPILGWFFGPVNMLTDSLTKTDFVTMYRVENMKIAGYYQGSGKTAVKAVSTVTAIKDSFLQMQNDKLLIPAAIVRQAIHYGSDMFTQQGLPLPFVSSINNDLSKDLLTKFHIDTYSVVRGATLSLLINNII